MNNVTLVGNVTRTPELRFTPNGKPVCNFSIAVNKRKRVDGEWTDELEGFFDCTLWNGAEHFADNFDKGSRVIVVGRLEQRTWEQDGNKRSKVEVQVDEVGGSIRFADSNRQPAAVSAGYTDEDGF